ncbi:MAG TPA: carboxypeptidase-like regulatory domain-containing protein [Candidatus Acidoferrum sp.]|nr:carboxypeptidase-like regulatory domain-containing protein [Candidatus Acidoferrum sp.]
MITRNRLRWIPSTSALFVFCIVQARPSIAAQTPSSTKDESSEVRFTIAGTVLSSSSGTPLDRARVEVSDVRNAQQVVHFITTEDGHFEFKGLKAGKYNLQGAKRGYLTAGYDQHEQYSTAVVTGPEFDTQNLVLRMTPLAVLSGKVYDEYGEPVRAAQIALYVQRTRVGMTRVMHAGNDMTDDQGYFEFPALAPGEYFLSASCTPWYAVHPNTFSEQGTRRPQSNVPQSLDVVYPTTFYNGATDPDAATPISVKAGDRVQADLHLSPVPTLHLLYRTSEEQQSFSIPSVQKRVFGFMEQMTSSGQMISPGLWELTGVPPGRYTVTQQRGARESTEIVLSENGQLDLSHAEPAAQLKLKVNQPPGEPQPKRLFLSLQDSRRQVVVSNTVDSGGRVSFENIAPGKYSILAGSSERAYTVARMAAQGIDITGHDVTLAPGASLELNLFLVSGVVRIEGFVKRGDKPAAGIMVALVPNPSSNLDMLRRDQSDFDGSFALRGVFPGSYTIVAIEDAWGTEWLQPEALKRYLRKGQNLTIGSLMEGLVHLPNPVQVQPR